MLQGPPPEEDTRRVTRTTLSTVFGGYDTSQVERLLDTVDQAIMSGSELQRARARQALRSPNLTRRLRGYSKRSVKRALHERSHELGSG